MSGLADAFGRRRTSFGAEVDPADYDAVRPGYPREAVRWLIGEPAGPVDVLDLGAGTGKLTRELLADGHRVVAVDPSEGMLARLRERSPGVDARVGTAEAIPVEDDRVDAVVLGQAWHWVDVPRAVPELLRVLRPGGLLGLVWNVRDGRDHWVAALDAMIGGGTAGDASTDPWGDWVVLPAPFGRGERRLFDNVLVLPASGVRRLVATWSPVATSPDVTRILDDVDAHARRGAATDGMVAIPHFCRCYRYQAPA